MDINIIEKSLTDAINKCGQRLTLPKSVKNSLNIFRKETCNPDKPRKTEKGYIIDNNGNIVEEKSGTKSSIKLDDKKLLELYDENGELHFEHNHPLYDLKAFPVFLSSGDISNLMKSNKEIETQGIYEDETFLFKSMTCEGSNGTRMTMVRGDNFTSKNKHDLISKNLMKKFEKDVSKQYQEIWDNITNRYYELHDDYVADHKGEIITQEMMDTWVEQATNEVVKSDTINLDKTFKDYQSQFSEYNLKITWESGL